MWVVAGTEQWGNSCGLPRMDEEEAEEAGAATGSLPWELRWRSRCLRGDGQGAV